MDAMVTLATFLLVIFAGVMILGVPILMARTTQRPITRGGKLRRAILLLVPEAAGWGILFQAIAMALAAGGISAQHMTGVALLWYWAGLACTAVAFAAMAAMMVLLLFASIQSHAGSQQQPHRQPAQ